MEHHIHSGAQKGHRPIHAFYLPPPANLVLSTASVEKETFATPTPTTTPSRILTATPTHVYQSTRSKIHSIVVPLSSSSTIPSISPFVIANSSPLPPTMPSPNNNTTSLTENSTESKNLPWLAPLLGVLGSLGAIVIIIAMIICCCRRRNKKEIFMRHRRSQQQERSTFSSSYQQRNVTNSYQSWNSFSTIQNDENRKTMSHIFSPASDTPVKQKRWTADTLVEEPSLVMLKKQYSPQLAFSPSLVAVDLQQQQQEHPALPENVFNSNNNNNNISPSNTLIDNAGVLSCNDFDQKKNYFNHLEHGSNRPRIEMYDPQVNLHDDDENPFETPYFYCNDQNEEQDHNHCTISKEQERYQVIDMNDTHK